MRILGGVLIAVVIGAMTIWAMGALYYAPLLPQEWRLFAAASHGAITVLASLFVPHRRLTAVGSALLCILLIILYYLQIPASNSRDWQPEVALTPYATINGDLVTIYNLRTSTIERRDFASAVHRKLARQ